MLKKLFKLALLGPPILAVLVAVWWLAQPWPLRLRWHDPESTSFMKYRLKEARRAGETLEIQHAWVPLEEIARPMQRAVILAEDGNFYEHDGVDWSALGEELQYDGEPPFSFFDMADLKAVGRALWYYGKNRDEVRGRSTITQQLAKNLYFTPERKLSRKFAEMVVAQRLEWFLTKDRILELYLNTVELGPGLFGVESAGRAYFDRSAKNLTSYQAASLAGTLPHPLTSNPKLKPSRMAWRRDLILGRMARTSPQTTAIPAAPETPVVELPLVNAPIDTGALLDSLSVPSDPSAPPPPASPDAPAVPPPPATPPDTVRSR
jgi:monofunctional biosynthetic peptidoglycan transglycosylase